MPPRFIPLITSTIFATHVAKPRDIIAGILMKELERYNIYTTLKTPRIGEERRTDAIVETQ